MPFKDAWKELQLNLTPNTTIINWTVAKGNIGDTFLIDSSTSNYIKVNVPTAENEILRVPVDDFEFVYSVWGDYKKRKVQRQELRDNTFYSKYIISIYNWLENRIGGELP